MNFKSISIFVFILTNVLVENSIITLQQKNITLLNAQQCVSCSSYYGMFFIDNTISGSKNLLEQLGLVSYFFGNGNVSNYSGSVTIVSQSNYSVTNNFSIAFSNDYGTLNKQINQILQQTPGGDQISLIDLLFDAYVLDFSDRSKYSLNPFLIFFVNSDIQNLNVTATLTSKFRNMHKLKTLSIVLDDNYSSQAAQLAGGKDSAFSYNLTDNNRIANANNWILQKTCTNQGSPEPTVSPVACDSIINFVLVATAEGLTKAQFDQQINLLKNYILPLWSDFSKFSLCVVFNGNYAECVPYGVFWTINEVNNYIDRIRYSSSTLTPLYLPLSRYTSDYAYSRFLKKMTTYIFLPYLNILEISVASLYGLILSSNSNLNIVTLGANQRPFSVAALYPTKNINWDFSKDTIPSIQRFVRNNIKCN